MKKQKGELTFVKHVKIDCEVNDKEDIKCGGPYYLGYDFYVSPTERNDRIEKFIRKLLSKYNQPIIFFSIFRKEKRIVSKVWAREDIELEIQKGY